jgi:UDP-N-acetylglucosamine 1-carboxyvinyltransferase
MARLIVRGGRPLNGTVRVGGRKNAAVAVIPAAILAGGPCTFENVPDIADVRTYLEILRSLGARVKLNSGSGLCIDPRAVRPVTPPDELVKKMRASYYLLGALLARFGTAAVALPGGCDIGERPIDQHLKGLKALGVEVVIEHGLIKARADKLHAALVYLDVTSVGATINIILAATGAEGVTVIENAAREPHVVDVANFINSIGGRVIGAGTDVVKVHGLIQPGSCHHSIIPDEIEAGTLMIAAAATRGQVRLDSVIPKHLEPISAKLREVGATVEENGDYVLVRSNGRPKAVAIKTLPYPGFPTDAQQPMTALLATADGTSLVTESVWEGRFKHVDELKRMGTKVRVEGRTAIIEGVERLTGAHVTATDLRAGAALVVAGLVAEGETVIEGIEYVDRGYERLDVKLRGLGADIRRE